MGEAKLGFPYLEGVLKSSVARPQALHLGYWPSPGEDCKDPRGALEDLVLALAQLADEQKVMDVGCGLGSTLVRADGAQRGARLVGVNLDPRQLAICKGVSFGRHNEVAWICADATRLPIADGAVDRVLCIEAAPHFASRQHFLADAARVLCPGGRLVGTDLFVRRRSPVDTNSPEDGGSERVLSAGAGSWPNVFESPRSVQEAAASAGLRVVHWEDISDHIAPNFPVPSGPTPRSADATTAMIDCLGRLQHSGRLRSILFGFERMRYS